MDQERPDPPLDLAYLWVALLVLAIIAMVHLVVAHSRTVTAGVLDLPASTTWTAPAQG